MNNTRIVPVELLETVYTRLQDRLDERAPTMVAIRDLLAQPQQEVEQVEVLGYVTQDDLDWDGDCTARRTPYEDYQIPVMTVAQFHRITEGLRAENDRLRSDFAESRRTFVTVANEMDAERNQLRSECEHLAKNLRGKHALTGATYSHLIAERDQLRAEYQSLHDLNAEMMLEAHELKRQKLALETIALELFRVAAKLDPIGAMKFAESLNQKEQQE